MIADRLEVRTRPGGANDADRSPRHHHFRPRQPLLAPPGDARAPGTEITLFLKSRFRFKHDQEAFEPGLRGHFGYPEGNGIQAGRRNDRPPVHRRLPRRLAPASDRCCNSRRDMVRIDERFHLDRLARTRSRCRLEKAAAWHCPASLIGDPEWGDWEWDDAEPPAVASASGSPETTFHLTARTCRWTHPKARDCAGRTSWPRLSTPT